MKKRILCIALVLTMFTGVCNTYAAGITYQGKTVEYTDQEPVIINDRTYVPIRDVFETLGFQVEWIAATKRVKLTNDIYILDVNMTTGILSIYDIGKKSTRSFELTDKPISVAGRTMLPLREILEAVGYSLEWDGQTKTTNILD